jgi:integrase
MSVYKPRKSAFWHYDFQLKGRRFHGTTGVETQRKAEAVERRIREQVALGTYDSGQGMTIDQAAGRWWSEVGAHRASAPSLEHRLAIIVRLIGKTTPIAEISTKAVARAIEKRRGETYARGADTDDVKATRHQLANATVNSDIIKPLRAILTRAATVWEIKGLRPIDWKALKLPEKETEIRLYSDATQQAWLDECDPTAAAALRLLLTYGLRLGELFCHPNSVVPEGPYLVLNNRKKGSHLLPLREDDARDLAARASQANAAGVDQLWFERTPKGKLVPVKYAAMQSRLRKAAIRAGITDARPIHGARHHVGTSILAATGNLRTTQKALGHADIRSTLVYAHALDEGLREAFNARNPLGAPDPAAEFTPAAALSRRRKKTTQRS